MTFVALYDHVSLLNPSNLHTSGTNIFDRSKTCIFITQVKIYKCMGSSI